MNLAAWGLPVAALAIGALAAGMTLGREAAVGLVHQGREACASARPLETIEAVRALPVRHN
ncbi:hypothetical protein ACPEIF_27065 [Streptomyces sp. NPDC012600]|uniref:hypothetical protein n=1 Tax=Streptomyces sp. NPDC012600 TaxID=3415005 RepID=UPI003C2CCFA1